MFTLADLVESAWTPELGGAFKGLQLCVKPYLFEEQKRDSLQLYGKDGRGLDLLGNFDRQVAAIKRLIIGWRGTPDEFGPDKLSALISHYAGTAVNVPGKATPEAPDPKPITLPLYTYVLEFAANPENYTGSAEEPAEKKS
jgi:hypothetical protein